MAKQISNINEAKDLRKALSRLYGRDVGAVSPALARSEIRRMQDPETRLITQALGGDPYLADIATDELARIESEKEEAENLARWQQTANELRNIPFFRGKSTGATIEPRGRYLSRARGIDAKKANDEYQYYLGEVDRLTKLIDKLKSEERMNELLKSGRYEMGPEGKVIERKKEVKTKPTLTRAQEAKSKALEKQLQGHMSIIDAYDTGMPDEQGVVLTPDNKMEITRKQRDASEKAVKNITKELEMFDVSEEIPSFRQLPRRFEASYFDPELQEEIYIRNPKDITNIAKEDRRADGTKKGPGYLGSLRRPDGKVSTELSIGVNIDGKEMEIPTLVPTLTESEIRHLLSGGKPTEAIVGKAVNHARKRMKEGKSVFATREDLQSTKPFKRVTKKGPFVRKKITRKKEKLNDPLGIRS